MGISYGVGREFYTPVICATILSKLIVRKHPRKPDKPYTEGFGENSVVFYVEANAWARAQMSLDLAVSPRFIFYFSPVTMFLVNHVGYIFYTDFHNSHLLCNVI